MKFDDVKEILIAEADRMGLESYEVYYMESAEINAATLKNEISSFSSGVQGGVCFRCIVDGHMGSASSELFEEDEMKLLVARAVENAKNIESDDKAILFGGSPVYAEIKQKKADDADAATLKEIALEMQKNTYAESEHVIDGTSSAAFVSKIKTELMNSAGLRLSNSVSLSGAYVEAAISVDGESQDGFDWALSFDSEKLKKVSEGAVKEAMSKIGAAQVASGKYDLVISGKQMRSLLSAYSSAFSAKKAQLGMSRLRGKEGEKVAANIVTLVDDPMREDSTLQTPFDGEGVATYKKKVIENGVLNTMLYDLATADKAGVESTGNGQRLSYANAVNIAPYSFYIEAGDNSLEDLAEKVGNGIYITAFNGMHAGCNDVTGDFSLESAGYMIENGKKGKPVKSFTIAGNFFDLLKNIEAVSDEVRIGMGGFTSFGAPSVLVKSISIAG